MHSYAAPKDVGAKLCLRQAPKHPENCEVYHKSYA
jgi:hypothetical protein